MEVKIKQKKFLICVLNWGIGHASRSIPIIELLLKYDQQVYIASDGDALVFLKRQFPHLECLELPSYDPIYPKGNDSMARKILFQIPKFSKAIKNEHILIEQVIREKRIDIVISDNRYGCYSNRVKSILITHQLEIQLPSMYSFLEPFVNYYNRKKLKNFYRVWVPDYKDDRNITGDLSSSTAIGTRFIGHLTRMKIMPEEKIKYDVLALLSGPEPQRSVLENIIKKQLFEYEGTSLIVRGKPTGSSEITTMGRVSIVDFLDTAALNEVIAQSNLVIARSGYSTIMDLAKLGKKAVFIPTPGQTEQLYLAKKLENRGVCYYQEQRNFKLRKTINKTKLYSGFNGDAFDNDILQDVILKTLR